MKFTMVGGTVFLAGIAVGLGQQGETFKSFGKRLLGDDEALNEPEGRELSTGATDIMTIVQQIASRFEPDPRFDQFSTITSTLTLLKFTQWPQLTSHWVFKPMQQADVPSIPFGLTGVPVPTKDEHWPDRSPSELQLYQYLLTGFSFPDTADDCGHWREGENPEAILTARTYNMYSRTKALARPGPNKYSDQGLEEMVFFGIGAHRVERVRGERKSRLPKIVRGSTHYAVFLDHMEAFEVRPGFAKLGANAFFDKDGNLLAIQRLGKWYYPGDTEWDYVKFTFRSSLLAEVTVSDHLLECHLLVGNPLVTANVENLPPQHPIRMLMTPFGYRTEDVNFGAAFTLANEFGVLHRTSPNSKEGLLKLLEHGKNLRSTWHSIPERLAQLESIRYKGKKLAYFEDGSEFYAIVKKFVNSYLAIQYANNDCEGDNDLHSWWDRYSSFVQLPPLTSCEVVEEVLSTIIFLVSAQHNHAGNIQHLTSDPRMVGTAWRENEAISTPRPAFTTHILAVSTSIDQPKIVEDYSHVLPSNAAHLWPEFTKDLLAFGERLSERNAKRPVAFRSFDPSIVETGVGV